jgi:hypothetical protein
MNSSSEQLVRHIVAIKFRPDAPEEQIQKLSEAFKALQDKIPGIIGFEYGVNNSPEGLNHGFTHVYVLTLENVAARDAYLPHPEHQKFGETAGQMGIIEEVFVIDFVPVTRPH